MFKNYIMTAWRNIIRHKLYAAINIGGLTLTLAAAILILLFVNDEVSFDKKWADSERIYRLETTFNTRSQGPLAFASTIGTLGPELKQEFVEVENFVRFYPQAETVRIGGELFPEALGYVDQEFLNIFDFEFIEGDASKALSDNQSIVLTRSSKEKYFGQRPAMGEVLTVNSNFFGQIDYRVSAVIEDVPLNSHMTFGSIALYDSNRASAFTFFDQQWNVTAAYTYIKFHNHEGANNFIERLPSYIDRVGVLPGRIATYIDQPSDFINLSIRPIRDIHLYSNRIAELQTPGSITTVYVFLIVGLLLIFIAGVNFVNLTTARASLRAKEIGLRKVMGAQKNQLRTQFLSETIITVFVALIFAFGATQLFLPWFNEFLTKDLTLSEVVNPTGFFLMIAGGVGLGILSGLYPSFILASFRPAASLKSNKSQETKGTLKLRNLLVGAQFSIAVALIVISSVIYSQMNHLQTRDMGLETEDVLVVTLPGTQATQDLENFKKQVELIPGVQSAGLASFAPGTFNAYPSSNFSKPGDDQQYGLGFISAGPGYFETLGVDLVAGRFLSENFALDLQPAQNDPSDAKAYSIVVNESMVASLGYKSPQEALGKIVLPAQGIGFAANAFQIVGVIPDIQILDAYSENRAAFFYYQPNPNTRGFIGTMMVKVGPNMEAGVAENIKNTWQQIFPENNFVTNNLAQLIDAVYANEHKQSISFRYFMVLAIALSTLGLYGLSSITAVRRTKEIGIRKVMGATIPTILRLLVWQFSKPVFIANIIGWPIAWYFLQNWLASFTQRIDLTIVPFIGAGFLAVLIAWVTVIGHAYKVARTNPVHALRYE